LSYSKRMAKTKGHSKSSNKVRFSIAILHRRRTFYQHTKVLDI
jgi:hypothetical protein